MLKEQWVVSIFLLSNSQNTILGYHWLSIKGLSKTYFNNSVHGVCGKFKVSSWSDPVVILDYDPK